jgi:biopolymer transport protein ExbB/TolQ
MTNLMQSQIFFFISSIGFVVLGILSIIILIYILRALQTLSRILNKAEKDTSSVGDIVREILEDIRNSGLFKFLFGNKKKHKNG